MAAKSHYTVDDAAVAELVKSVRLDLGKTQTEFAEAMGIATQNYQRAETKGGRFTAGQLLRLRRAFSIRPEKLLPKGHEQDPSQ